jgi:polar amino acid transport system substrate-binding protein
MPLLFHYLSMPHLLEGIEFTVEVTALGLCGELIPGVVLAAMQLSRFRVMAALARGYTVIFRGKPLMLQMVSACDALPHIGILNMACAMTTSKEPFMQKQFFPEVRNLLLGIVVVAGFCAPVAAGAATAATPAGCAALQTKYEGLKLKGKTLVNATSPHTPGYEAIDPKDPNQYVGFDIDLGEQIGDCLGFKLTYKAVTFAALLTTMASGQADIVISDLYATEERAKVADFVTYSKVFDGVLVAKNNPKKITGTNISMCGAAAAENTGYVEVPLVQDLAPQCKAAGKAEPTVQLYDNNANCIQAILAGRADTYVNDVNTVDQAVKANPDQLEKAGTVTIPYSVGIAVPKDKPEFRDAVMAALVEIQKAGIHKELLKKWELDPNNFEEPHILSVK